MGKEILLKDFLKQPRFSSQNPSEFGVVRMHEYETCEIPLLRSSDSTIRPSAPAMCSVQANLDGSAQEAGPSKTSDSRDASQRRVVEQVYPASAGPAAGTLGLAHLSLSIPPGLASP